MYFKKLSRIAKLALHLERRAIENNQIELAYMYGQRWCKIFNLMSNDIKNK